MEARAFSRDNACKGLSMVEAVEMLGSGQLKEKCEVIDVGVLLCLDGNVVLAGSLVVNELREKCDFIRSNLVSLPFILV